MTEIADERKIVKSHSLSRDSLRDDRIVEVKFLVEGEYSRILTNTIGCTVVDLIEMNYLIFVSR